MWLRYVDSFGFIATFIIANKNQMKENTKYIELGLISMEKENQ